MTDIHHNTPKLEVSPEERAYLAALPAQQAYRYVETKHKQAARYVQELRTLQNSFVPVNRLPNELLMKIFRHVDDRNRHMFRPLRCLVFLRVCQHWYALALATPSLWADIDMSKGDRFIQMCLARSKNALLNIYCPTNISSSRGFSFDYILTTITPYSARIRSLRLRDVVDSGVHSYKLAPLMPRLEILDLYDNYGYYCELCADEPLPNLRSISLGSIVVRPDSPIFTDLITLTLHQVSGFETSMESILCVLENCRGLQQLTLECSIGPNLGAFAVYPEPSRLVPLPELRTLYQYDSRAAINLAYFLAHLIIPPTATITLRHSDGTWPYDVENYHPTLTDLLPRDISRVLHLIHIRSLCMAATDDGGSNNIVMHAYAHEHSAALSDLSSDDEPANWNMKIGYAALRHRGSVWPLVPMTFHDVTEVFSSAPVVTLDFRSDFESISEHHWRDALLRLPCLEVLYVESVEVKTLFEALQFAGTSADTICPCLRVLAIKSGPLGNEIAQWGVSCLEARAAKGAPRLQKLRMTYSGVAEDDLVVDGVLDELKALVDCLSYDTVSS